MTAFSGLSFFASFILPKIKVEENKASPPKDDPVKDIDLQILPVSDTDKQVNSEPEKPKVIPLSESVKTMSFAFHNIWLLNIYMTRFYITSFNTWAWKTTSDPNQSMVIFFLFDTFSTGMETLMHVIVGIFFTLCKHVSESFRIYHTAEPYRFVCIIFYLMPL